MSRMVHYALAFLIVGLLAANSAPAAAASATPTSNSTASVVTPKSVVPGVTTAIKLRLSPNVAAVEGRVFVNTAAAEFVGVAPLGTGTATRPVRSGKGYAFAAYGLQAKNGHTTIRIVVFPRKAGVLQVRVTIDSTADVTGHRLTTSQSPLLSTLGVGHGAGTFRAPAATPAEAAPTRAAGPARKLVGNGKINAQDLDAVRGDWYTAHETAAVCGRDRLGDANSDRCVDVVDLQAELAALGTLGTRSALVPSASRPAALPATLNHTFVVTSTADTPDAVNGDDICADANSQCTLRAAMTEASWVPGANRIEFALSGTAPVTIQLTSRLPDISSRNSTVTIDGYTQPGSRVNTATVGSNAIPGVEIKGNGKNAKEMAFYVTSAGNTIRGLLIDNVWNGIFIDGTGAHDNKIIGNIIGFNKNGTAASFENFAIILNTGANRNFDGTPSLADRNVIGNYTHAEENYGPGTDNNTTQNNVFCIGPTGMTTATCATGIDHNFGPKNHLIGGMGTNEKNVFGPTTLQGIELSHGWDPSNHGYTTQYTISGVQIIGNWVGFRGDGSYNASYRSGLNFSSADNDQGIHVYDGTDNNIVDSNYVASVYDGIQVMSPNATGNIVRNNIIGVSPLGQAAPLTGWGMKIRWSARHDTFQGNVIRNAALGGFGLVNTNNTGGAQAVAYNIRLTQNIVSDTSGPAIGLYGDADDNSHLSPPVIAVAGTAAVSGTAVAGATVELYRASRAVGQTGLPITYLGSTVVTQNGHWSIRATLNLGDIVTALQIRTDDNTSQLAPNVAVGSAPANHPPAFNTDRGDRTDAEHVAISFSAAATDQDGDTLTYSATGLPTGISIDPASGLVSGTLSYSSAGSNAVVISVTDGNATVTDSFTWNVTNTDRPPVATVALSPAKPGTNATVTATATKSDPDGDAVGLTYTWKVNGTTVRTSSSATALTDTLDLSQAGNGDLGDVIRVEVTPNDGATDGTKVADQVTVTDPGIYASDDFSRTVNTAWGTAATGGAYTTQGTTADYGVNGSVGTINLAPAMNRSAVLNGISQTDVDLSFRFAVNKLAVGGQQFIYGVVRRVSSTTEYRAKARIAPTGAVYVQATAVVGNVETGIGSEFLVTGLTASPGNFLRMRTQISGASPTTIKIRVWADGTTEPTTWQVTSTDSTSALQVAGAIGVRAYVGSAVTNGPIQVSIDDLRAAKIQ